MNGNVKLVYNNVDHKVRDLVRISKRIINCRI